MAVTIEPGAKAGMDWSFSKIPPQFLVDRGVKLAMRYIGGSQGKRLTKPERDALFDAGIAIFLNYEDSAGNPLSGAAKGKLDGAKAKQQAQALDYPGDMPILVSCDIDVTAGTLDAVEAYVRAFAQECSPYPIGVYGDTDILAVVQDLSKVNWLPNASSWSDADSAARDLVHIRQRTTVTVGDFAFDPNDIEKPVRAWFPERRGIRNDTDNDTENDNRNENEEDDMAASQLPATAALVTVPGLANAFLVGAGPALHLDPVLFEHYRDVVKVPVVRSSDHDQLLKSLAHQSGTDLLGLNAVPIT